MSGGIAPTAGESRGSSRILDANRKNGTALARAKIAVPLSSRLVVVVVHAGVITVPPIGASSHRSLAAQPPATPIAIAVVAGPPTDSDADKAVVKVAMVVMGEVVVVVTMHVVAMPIITVITVPRGATMPAISIQSTHTGDLSATYVTAAKMAHVSSADVADVGCTDLAHASATVGASMSAYGT